MPFYKVCTCKVLRIFFMDQSRKISSIIKDHVERLATLESGNRLLNTPNIFFFGFTLPGEDRDTGSGDAKRTDLVINPDCSAMKHTPMPHDPVWRRYSVHGDWTMVSENLKHLRVNERMTTM